MKLAKKTRTINSFVWRCRQRTARGTHDVERGLYATSIFENAKISARHILILLYEWATETPVVKAVYKSGISERVVIKMYAKFRKLCTRFLERNPILFGGEGNIVQLDESKFIKLKHNRGEPSGTMRRKYWAFGIQDARTKRVFIKLVRNRKRRTVFPIILEKIIPSSTIWTDEFSV